MNAMVLLAAITSFNWAARIPEGGMKYEAEGDKVTVTLTATGFEKGGDGCLTASVPLYRRGSFEFDFRETCDYRNRTVGPFIGIYGIRTFFHDSCRDWRAYFPEPNSRRQIAFDIEPVQHKRIAGASVGDWHHCRIVFDRDNDRVEYFIDDMEDPAFITGDRSVWGADEYEGGAIRIGGMGGSLDAVCEFKNLKLEEVTSEKVVADRTETLVFNGFASSHFDVEKLLANDKPRVYFMDTVGSRTVPDNCFKLSKLPGTATIAKAKRIVLVDQPFQPDDIVPDFLVADIVAAVEDGAELIVIDGFFSLARGEYAGTALAKILPEGTMPESPFSRFDKPEILERTVGKGKVKVFRGFKFPVTVEESRAAFAPWAEKLFGVSASVGLLWRAEP